MERFKQVFFDESPDLLTVTDMDGHFSELNASWTRVLGWSLEELKSRPWTDFIHPDDMKKSVQAHFHVKNGGVLHTLCGLAMFGKAFQFFLWLRAIARK